MNARRVVRRVILGFSLLSLVMMGLLWYGLSSERVARRLVATALARAGDGISIGEVSGSIGGPLVVRNVSVERETFAATIDSALVDWTPTGLLRRQVRIDRLHAEGVHITIPDSVPRDSAPPRPSLPMDVILGDVLVRNLSVDAPGELTLRRGTLRLDGRAEDFRFVAEGKVAMPRLEDALVVASGTGNLDHIMLTGSSASVLEGTVSAVGRVTWWPRTEWNLAIQGSGIEPALLTEDPAAWPGSIAFDGRISGHLDSLGPWGSLIIDSLGGGLRDQPLRATGTIGFAGPSLESPGVTVSWGSAQLTGSGTVGDTIAASYRLALSSLGTALPEAGGSLSARGTVSGPREAPRIQATFSGSGIRYGNNTAKRAEGQADIRLAPSGRTHVTVRGTDARAGSLAVDSLELLMRGTQDRHRIIAAASGPDGRGSLLLAGGLADRRWRGQLQDLLVQAGRYGSWKLAQSATLAAAMERASLGETCLASEEFPGARLCAGGEWLGGQNWRATSVVERLPLALFDSLVPDSVLGDSQRLAGTVSAVLEASSRGGRLDGRLVARADSAAFLYQRVLDTAPRWIALDTAAAEFTVGAQGLQGELYLHALHHDSVAAGWLSGTVVLPRFTRLGISLESQPIEAGLEGRIDTLGYAAEYFPGMDSLAGSVALDAQLAGMAAAPSFEVRVDFDSLFVWLPRGRAGQGSVALHAQGNMNPDRSLAGTLEVMPRGVIYDYTLDELPRRVFVDSGGLTGATGSDGTSATFALGVSDSADNRILTLAADLALPGYTALGRPVAAEPFEARLEAEVPSFAFVRAATDRYDSLAGSISLSASAGGRIATPNLEAELRIDSLYARSITGTETRASLLGTLSAAVADDSTLSGLLRLTPDNVRFAYVEGGVFEEIRLNPTELEVRAGPQGVRGVLDLAIADTTGTVLGTFGGRFALPGYRRYGQSVADADLEAAFQAEVQDLAFAEAFSPEVDSLAGSLDLDVQMTGTVGDPGWSGGFRLRDGAMRLPLLGALYRDIQLAATGTEAGDLRVEGGAESGAGQVTVQGTTPVRPTAERPGRFTIRGNDFEVMNTAQVHAVVDPELDVVLIADTIDLSGSVNVPLARIQLTEIPEFAVPPSDDVVFVGDTAAPPPARPIRAEVQVVLGDSVTFTGFNFNAELDGALLLMESPGRPTRASGAVIIETGGYKAYGQDLSVTEGRVRFAGGPVDNPSLSIRASRMADDGTEAGLAIGGTLKSPVVTIWSEPAMSQNSALHYIVTGRAPGEGSVASGGLLSKAASSLGLRGSNVLARSLGEGFGLDDARIETEDGLQEAAFVAGAYLSPSLYVSYGIGLFDPISTLRLRYLLSERWTVQAEAGAETGADLLYRIER